MHQDMDVQLTGQPGQQEIHGDSGGAAAGIIC